jgi:signal transduction histidine kinase
MLSVISTLYLSSILLNFLLGSIVFLKGPKEKINRDFFILILIVESWLISLFLFYILEQPTIVLWMGRFNFAIVLLLLYRLLCFAIIFPKKTFSPPKKSLSLLKAWIFIFILITIFTPWTDKQEIIVGFLDRETIYGPLHPLFVFHYVIFSAIGVWLIYQKFRSLKEKLERYQLAYFLGGLTLALGFGFVTQIFLPLFGIYQTQNLGPLVPLFFSGPVAYAISKYYLFNIKIIATEFFVGTLGMILLIQAVLSDNPALRLLNFLVFGLFLVFGYFLIKSVINEVQYREKLKVAYDELKKLDESKSEFVSIASHQLRTPLSTVKGYISMILEGTYGEIAKRTKLPLERVYDANEKLIKLVNNLLDVSKIEAGKIDLEKQSLSVEELIEEATQVLKISVEKKNLYLRFEKPTSPLPKVFLDKEKFSQAILNIIDNAIRYTEKGGITISMEKSPGIPGKIVIEIKDTGIGMEKEELDHLFESFSRGTAGSKHWTEGAGLGLYVAKKFITMHNGEVWAESEGDGKGSTFYIEIPVAEK